MFGAREPASTIKFVDDYCEWYRKLFPEVRSFEAFKYLHVGMISDIKRKTLPARSRVVGLSNEQGLLHFLTESPWELEQLRLARLRLILKVLAGREITLIIDETGDRKKGSTTDYVKRQYIGNLGKIENGIVAVTAYGLLEGITFPLIFEVYRPQERLLEGDRYLSKPKIAIKMIMYLQTLGFKFKLVLADSLYGESHSTFIKVLNELQLNYAVAIRSNHGVWLPQNQTVRQNRWRTFDQRGRSDAGTRGRGESPWRRRDAGHEALQSANVQGFEAPSESEKIRSPEIRRGKNPHLISFPASPLNRVRASLKPRPSPELKLKNILGW